MLPSHNRFEYSPITERPQFTWPGGRRLAVYVAVCIEHFPYNAGGLGLSYSPGLEQPNTYNWAWREYGNRVGGFRLLDLLSQFEITPTVLVNGECFEHCPQLMDVYRAAGTEFVAHGMTNGQHPNELDEASEREMIGEVRRIVEEATGDAPRGWMSPGANPSANTEDLLAEYGFTYTLDWPMDDQPVWMSTRSGPLMAVPYAHEVNDVPAIVMHDLPARDFAEMMVDNVAEQLEQAHNQSLVAAIVLHTFIIGQPYRLRLLRAAFQEIQQASEQIWFTTPAAIADHYSREGAAAPTTAAS
jgi:Polysaccharide deacetylase